MSETTLVAILTLGIQGIFAFIMYMNTRNIKLQAENTNQFRKHLSDSINVISDSIVKLQESNILMQTKIQELDKSLAVFSVMFMQKTDCQLLREKDFCMYIREHKEVK